MAITMKLQVIDKYTGKIVWKETFQNKELLTKSIKELKEKNFNPEYFKYVTAEQKTELEKWNIRYYEKDGTYQSIVLTDIHKVSDYERQLREQDIIYATDYYKGSELIKKSDRSITPDE